MMLVIGGIFALVFSILLINDLESDTITQYDHFSNNWSSSQNYSKIMLKYPVQ